MSALAGAAGTSAAPTILVVDDDKRVVDLLNIALAAHGYRVITAADGEEAVRVAFSRRPDLVVLDVRLPRKSGLEVCELLRQDPDDPFTPIIMVSAASETEARLQGFARGADDYLTKPFSPKELVARIRRLLARATEAREARRRGRDAEVELSRAREDMKRAHLELRREQRLRALTTGIARTLQGTLDAEALAARFLLEVQVQTGVSVAALLAPSHPGGPFVPGAIRGDGRERVAGLDVARDGELMALLAALGRPARRIELERFPELRDDVLALAAAGFSLIAPLGSGDRIEAVLLADERRDGNDVSRADLEALGLLCDATAAGLESARRSAALAGRMVEMLDQQARGTRSPAEQCAHEQAAALAAQAACAMLMPAGLALAVRQAVALGSWITGAEGRQALIEAAAADPTGRLARLAGLALPAGEAHEAGPAHDDEDEQLRAAIALVRLASAWGEARARGRDASRAFATLPAPGGAPEDAARQALGGAIRAAVPARR